LEVIMGSHELAMVLLAAGSGGGLLGSLTGLPLLLIMFAAMYFLLIAPNQKKQKQWQSQLAALKPGDRITTSGGLRGTVVSIKDDALVIKTQPDGLKLECVKTAVAAVTTEDVAKS
jgi:preprotein translocase subunit YajC